MKNNFQPKHNATISFSAHLFIFILLANLLSSCGAVIQTPMPTETVVEINPIIESPETVEATSIPPTEEATDMLTASPTSEAAATATEILESGEISAERKQEIVDRVNAFINAEGQYSDEELRKDPTWFDLDTDESKPLPLGMINSGSLQAILVDYQLIDNNCHYFLGILLRNNERAVFDFSQSIETDIKTIFVRRSGLPAFNTDSTIIEINDFKDKSNYLNKLLGKPAVFQFMIDLHLPENVEVFYTLMASALCQEYYTDLWNLVPILENTNRNYNSGDNKQSVLYFSKENLLKKEDFPKILKDNLLCSSLLVFRSP